MHTQNATLVATIPATFPAAQRRPKILVVEDQLKLAKVIQDYLDDHGYDVHTEHNGSRVAERIAHARPDLMILDLTLPGKDGFQVCRETRATSTMPILVLTARNEDTDHILSLELGADDFVVKPIEPRVLLARSEALLRRAQGAYAEARRKDIFQFGPLTIDKLNRRAAIDGHFLELTWGEFDVLWLLASMNGTVVSRDDILGVLRGIAYDGMDRSVDVKVHRLRAKLNAMMGAGWMIRSVRARGYLLSTLK